MMKPKGQTEHETGILEYLEDIIGSNQFLPRIAETFKEVEGAAEIVTSKLHRAKHIEKELKELQVCICVRNGCAWQSTFGQLPSS
jgi:structural maintenance of chromosome 4